MNPEIPLPANLDAERMLLGAMIDRNIDPSELAAAVQPEDFSLESHRRIFAALIDCDSSGSGVSNVLLIERLSRAGHLESVGGFSAIADLTGTTPRLSSFDSYVNVVRDKSIRRQAILACESISKRAYDVVDETPDLLAQWSRLAGEIEAQGHTERHLKTAEDVVSRFGSIELFLTPPKIKNVVPTPWSGLNYLLTGGGFAPGQLILIAARPGIGKTAAACQIGMHAARHGIGTTLFTLEMPDDAILHRMVCSEAQVNSWDLRRGRVGPSERHALQAALSSIYESPLWVDDSTGCSVPAMRSQLRKHVAKKPLGLVIVDYLQLVESTGRASYKRVDEVGEISRSLKKLARELRVPVIALSQLSRDSAKDGRRPQLHDLRDSGALEQDADIVIFPWAKKEVPHGQPVDIELIVAKQRGGPTGKVEMYFLPQFTLFRETEQNAA